MLAWDRGNEASRKVDKKEDIPRFELGLLDSKSNVITLTPYVLGCSSPSHDLLDFLDPSPALLSEFTLSKKKQITI